MAGYGHRFSAPLLATAILLLVFVIASYNSISVTNFSISDSDPSGYIIVPMLMLLVFIVFSFKEKLSIKYSLRNIAYGLILAAVYFVVYAYANVSLSFLFETYRIDAIMFPILLSSFAVMLFGTDGLNKLKPAIIFSLFASPLLLMPILNLSYIWTSFNAYSVFNVIKILGAPVLRHGIVISGASGSAISIASTCADIAAFIGMLMFLIPVAYVYNGPIKKRVMWVVSSMLLLFVLNIARMSAIAMVWAYYGLSAALNTVHLFIGQLLFDITLIVMILLAPKFAMYIRAPVPRKPNTKTNRKRMADLRHSTDHRFFIPVITSIILAVLVLLFTLPLQGYSYISPFAFATSTNSMSNSSVISSYDSIVLHSNSSIKSLTFSGKAELFGVYKSNDINTSASSFLFINTTAKPSLPAINQVALGNIIVHREEATSSGITINAYVTNSEGKLFQINYVSIPNRVFGNYTVANMEFVSLLNSTSNISSCKASAGTIPSIYSYIYNALHASFSNSDSAIFCPALYSAGAARA
ncbi:MAG: exosortase/archaeosortase family protein [Candidatus Marsarchaeota archaeon]|jgi:exosortase/archaeosortase family protein|nr:exosortase/archaeosortase family protein [Candidatus Marsarchaeota archaeon]